MQQHIKEEWLLFTRNK